MKLKTKREMLFLDKESSIVVKKDQKYHLVLSPSLYWVKREKLPVKHLYEVKKIVATLFEESLAEGRYSYAFCRDKDAFLLFAYEEQAIVRLLAEKGISIANITAVSFAQTALEPREKPLLINSKEVLTWQNGVAIVLPLSWFDSYEEMQTVFLKPSKPIIKLEQFGHIVDKKLLYRAALFLLFATAVVFAEYCYYSNKIDLLADKKEKLFTTAGLKPTLMQNRAILSHYRSVANQEEKIRKYMEYILKAKLSKGEKIDAIEYKNKKLVFSFSGVTKESLKRIFAPFYKDGAVIDIKEYAKELRVEVKL